MGTLLRKEITARADLSDHPCSPQTFQEILSTQDFFGLTSIYREFESSVGWKVEAILNGSRSWLKDLEFLGITDAPGQWLCPSFKPDQLLSTFIPKKLSGTFRALVETSIITYNCGPDALIPDPASIELNSVHSFAGRWLVKALEIELCPSNLAKNSIDQLAGLFLLLFGTTTAVSYLMARTKSPEVSLMHHHIVVPLTGLL